jgi:hypothetical protein
MIKNNTPYLGKLKFKFEKYPKYTDGTVLNKIHLNLGFTKLVSRVSSEIADPAKVQLINRYTGGRIATYKIKDYPEPNGGLLHNSFVTLNGDYIGDIRVGWWYYLNSMAVCPDQPTGVAEIWGDEIIGYYGYSHRGGCAFKIGDRLFDPNFKPMEKHYEPYQWAGWIEQLESDLKQADSEWYRKDIASDGVAKYIPFNLRGRRVIKNMKDAKQAAINMSQYLS